MASEIRVNQIQNRSGLTTTTFTDTGVTISGILTVSDDLNVGGVLTYEDVTNIDSVGIVTARAGINLVGNDLNVGSNINIGNASGIVTATSFSGSGANLTSLPAANLTGTLPAISGANLTSLPAQATIANNADNRVITGGSGVNLNGEANLTYGGGNLQFTTTANGQQVLLKSTGNYYNKLSFDSGNTSAGGSLAFIDFSWDGDKVADIFAVAGSDTTNKDDGHMVFRTSASQGAIAEALRITSTGNIGINQTSPQRRLHIGTSGTAEANIRLQGGSDYAELRVKDSDNVFSIHTNIGGAGSVEKLKLAQSDATLNGTTDGVLNLNTTDSRGPFIRYQESGTTKCWVGSGQGLSLGTANDLGLRATTHIRMRSGSEEHGVLTSEGHFAAKGDAGSWVGSTSPTNTLVHQFCNTGNGRWAMQIQQEHHNGMCLQLRIAGSGNQEAFQIYKYNSTASTRFRVLQNGNCANVNNSFGSLSDVSLKENIVDANSQWNDIKAIKVRNFNFKDDKDTKLLGVVAQELETVSPKLVWEDKEGLKGVSYSVLYMKAIKALQESMTRIETLEAEVAALKGS